MRRRGVAAHFLLHPELAGSPPNEALISALLELGLDVDLYAGGPAREAEQYGPRVRQRHVEYHSRWLARHALSPRWRRYALLSGTSELPMGVVGVLARLHRRPSMTLADEIRSGTYRGNASERWKRMCRAGMRRSDATIVNDPVRIDLQREYAGLPPQHPVVSFPSCFRVLPEPGDRDSLRAARGIPQEALVLGYSGLLSEATGGLWLADALASIDGLHVWASVLGSDPLVAGLLQRVRGAERLHLETERSPSWHAAWSKAALADVGLVVYLQDAQAFRNVGVASNRLCMFLGMGIPVIASRQPSFEFLERYECGRLVDRAEDLPAAVEAIAARLPAMRANALRCTREHIAAPLRYETLRATIARVLGREEAAV